MNNLLSILMKSVLTAILSLVVSLCLAHSKDSTVFRPKFYIYAGSFFPTINTTVRVDGDKVGIGSQLGLEDNFDMDAEKTTIRVDSYWDITKRSGVEASFFYLNRSSTLTLNKDITFGDSTYHVGESIYLWFNTSFYSAGYRYYFFSHDNWKAGLSTGINWLQIGTGIDATGNKNYSSRVTFPAPTPYIGMHIQGYLSPRLHARFDFKYFGLTIAGISGRVYDNKMMMEYYIFKNVGIGAAFNIIAYTINEIPVSDKINGNVRFNVNGFNLFLATRF